MLRVQPASNVWPMTIKIRGLKGVTEALKKHPELITRTVGAELRKQGEIIMTAAKELTPVQFGTLKNSGNVQGPEQKRGKLVVTLGFGGPAQKYAVYVHENMTARHNPPTQAKFLETPARAAKRRIRTGLVNAVSKVVKAIGT